MGRDPGVDDKWQELSSYPSTSHLNESTGSRAQKHKSVQISEAADIFGDVQTAEDYGYVNRGCVIFMLEGAR